MKKTLRTALPFLLLALTTTVVAQAVPYDPPLRGPLLVTGTFGELRSDHFHAGLDFRAPVGTPVHSVADGYVSRIVVSGGGYGQGVYVDHPDGRRSVYAHLETLAPELLDTVRARQYAEERFAVNLRFDSTAFPLRRGQVIGAVGNRGHSFGAHLHFEWRDQSGDVALNPFALGFPIRDTRPPAIRSLRVYALDERGLEITAEEITPTELGGGRYRVNDTLFVSAPRIGLAVKAYDRQDAMPNWNGIYGGDLFADSLRQFIFRFDRIPFEQSEYLNALTDYAVWTDRESWFHRYWLLNTWQFRALPQDAGVGRDSTGTAVPARPLYGEDYGRLRLRPGVPRPVRLTAVDYAGNESQLTATLLYRPSASTATSVPLPADRTARGATHHYVLPAGEPSLLDNDAFRLLLEADALYQDCYFRYATLADRSAGHASPIHQLHDRRTPLHGRASLALRPYPGLADSLRAHAFVGHCRPDGRWVSHGGEWQPDGRLEARISRFGDYAIFLDTLPPTVRIDRFSTDLRRAAGFSLLVEDNVDGGGLSWRATIDDRWVLLEHDAKSNRLDYTFTPDDFPPGKHHFELTVNDGRGNSTTWHRRFRR